MADPVAQVPVEAPPASVLDPDFLVKIPTQIIRQTYDRRDTILYALGVGAGQRADHPGDLPFVLEDRLLALPTMAVVLASPGFWQMEPRYGIDWQRVLHAEQSCDFHAPLPVEGAVRGEFSIEAIVDKGPAKGAILRARRLIYDQADNRLLATVRQTSFLRGDGGRGSAGGDIGSLEPVPDRAPDHMVPMTTRPEQALLYRLSGDYNPLHADPAVASAAGFQRPILHGLGHMGWRAAPSSPRFAKMIPLGSHRCPAGSRPPFSREKNSRCTSGWRGATRFPSGSWYPPAPWWSSTAGTHGLLRRHSPPVVHRRVRARIAFPWPQASKMTKKGNRTVTMAGAYGPVLETGRAAGWQSPQAVRHLVSCAATIVHAQCRLQGRDKRSSAAL